MHLFEFIIITLPLLIIVALVFMGIGLKVLIGKRPFILPSRVFRIIFLVCLLPIVLRPLFEHSGSSLALTFAWIAIVFMQWRQVGGYTIFGVSNPAFRDSLVASLAEKGHVFREDMTGLTLEGSGIKIEGAAATNGAGRIYIRDKRNRAFLSQVAEDLRQYYRTHDVTMTYGVSIFNVIIGVLLNASIIPIFFLPHVTHNF